ncbi:MAG: alkaline phosphatase family protein [Bacteroidales bacterium]|jgi:predicted AlkP superfamily pyrophosphatase or phosphodiesterase|nr:alkaline phosphatase family protein [Bacteroidales bacterium]MDI9552156.1 alkaline phosphatase family protein [Bacteroidota bacterium]NLK54220.1 alkaline phosphatase family protein [Bacteroidales bacterium]HNY53134.1 alkaline phosphatase family protein [Bacteroidales bacterium]HPB13212.1 alkaline phosphatase family protein [Bacteroidales bacterium]
MTGKKLIAICILIGAFLRLSGQGAYLPPDKPSLIIGIVVEQLRFDQIERLRDRFSDNGIKRMINEGTFFKNASYDYMLTQSAPGFSTIATGTEPAYHGITSDNWYVPLKNEFIYCTKDISVNPVGGSYESGLHSPVNLNASTFADELKIATGKKSKVFSVGVKEQSAILTAGHSTDGVFWYDNVTGGWMSSTYYVQALPSWVNDFNAMRRQEAYLNSSWTLLKEAEAYSTCLPDSNKFEKGFGGQNYFPYDLNKLSKSGGRNSDRNNAFLRETPFADALTTDFAIKLIEEEELGKDDVTDFLSICYSSTDYIGHRFGPSSVETADAIFRLDKNIETLLNYLNDNLGKRNILVYFTSAHGVAELPQVMADNRVPSGYFMQNQALQLLRSYLNAVYGEGDWVKGFTERQVFLNRTLIEDARLQIEDVQKRTARFLNQFTGVASAYPYYAFEANDFGNGHLRKIINSFSAQRSGDVIITLLPGWVEAEEGHLTGHNSPYEYDSHVPLIWYGWTVNRSTVMRKVNLTDVAATLSSLCRIPYPNACTGEPMPELFR